MVMVFVLHAEHPRKDARKSDKGHGVQGVCVGASELQAMSYGFTALHVAAWHGRDDVVKSLLKAKGDPLHYSSFGSDAVALALVRGHAELAYDLIDEAKKRGEHELLYKLTRIPQEQQDWLNEQG
jgi:hypothetical protein